MYGYTLEVCRAKPKQASHCDGIVAVITDPPVDYGPLPLPPHLSSPGPSSPYPFAVVQGPYYSLPPPSPVITSMYGSYVFVPSGSSLALPVYPVGQMMPPALPTSPPDYQSSSYGTYLMPGPSPEAAMGVSGASLSVPFVPHDYHHHHMQAAYPPYPLAAAQGEVHSWCLGACVTVVTVVVYIWSVLPRQWSRSLFKFV